MPRPYKPLIINIMQNIIVYTLLAVCAFAAIRKLKRFFAKKQPHKCENYDCRCCIKSCPQNTGEHDYPPSTQDDKM